MRDDDTAPYCVLYVFTGPEEGVYCAWDGGLPIRRAPLTEKTLTDFIQPQGLAPGWWDGYQATTTLPRLFDTLLVAHKSSIGRRVLPEVPHEWNALVSKYNLGGIA